MSTTTHKFPVAKYQAKRKGPCTVCGKMMHRTRTFQATQNPFNKDADGKTLSMLDVLAQAAFKAEQWWPEFTHAKCTKPIT